MNIEDKINHLFIMKESLIIDWIYWARLSFVGSKALDLPLVADDICSQVFFIKLAFPIG